MYVCLYGMCVWMSRKRGFRPVLKSLETFDVIFTTHQVKKATEFLRKAENYEEQQRRDTHQSGNIYASASSTLTGLVLGPEEDDKEILQESNEDEDDEEEEGEGEDNHHHGDRKKGSKRTGNNNNNREGDSKDIDALLVNFLKKTFKQHRHQHQHSNSNIDIDNNNNYDDESPPVVKMGWGKYVFGNIKVNLKNVNGHLVGTLVGSEYCYYFPGYCYSYSPTTLICLSIYSSSGRRLDVNGRFLQAILLD